MAGVIQRSCLINYYIDTEFIEDGSTIDLISIGIVSGDGREYYAISTEFKPRKASQWVKDNVLSQLPPKPSAIHNPWISPTDREASKAWKSRKEIAHEVEEFLLGTDERPSIDGYLGKSPEIWADYAAYDHVALCQLWGEMMDLPKGMPMWTNDIRQEWRRLGNPNLPEQGTGEHNAISDARWVRDSYLFLKTYQEGLLERK